MQWLKDSISVSCLGCNTFIFIALVIIFSSFFLIFFKTQLIITFCTLNFQGFFWTIAWQWLHRSVSHAHKKCWCAVTIRWDTGSGQMSFALPKRCWLSTSPFSEYQSIVLSHSMSKITEVMYWECAISCHTRIVYKETFFFWCWAENRGYFYF